MRLGPKLKDIQQLHHMRVSTDPIKNDRLSHDLLEAVVPHLSQTLDGYRMVVSLSGASEHLAEGAIAQSTPQAVSLVPDRAGEASRQPTQRVRETASQIVADDADTKG